MSTFVLLPGAFRGAWSWSRVVPLLEAHGHRGVAVELAGADDPTRDLETHLDRLEVATINASDEPAWLVAHSQGGVFARALTARIGDGIAGIAYLDAAVPEDGEAAIDLLPGGVVQAPPRDLVLAPSRPVPGDWLSAEDAAWIQERLTPQAAGFSLDRVTVAARRPAEHYAFCAGTPDTFPSATTRARLDARGTAYELLAAGHDAPITAPALVADWLVGLVATTAP